MIQQEIDLIVNKFTSCGWEPSSSWDLGNVHTFITFLWDKDTDPIYPSGYQPSK